MSYVVSKDGIKIDQKRIAAVAKLPVPKSQKILPSALGFFQYSHRFIKNYSKIAAVLYELLKDEYKDKFPWEPKHQEAFEQLKHALTTATTLYGFDTSKLFDVYRMLPTVA